MKRIILFNLLFVIIANSYLNAQNPGWILAPNYIGNVGITIPEPLPASVQPAVSASNMQLDAQGNILFFVIDNMVYDKDGSIIGDVQGPFTDFPDYYCIEGVQGTELTIIPDPSSCSKYYIIFDVSTR